MSDQYGFLFLLDGVDITDKVKSFTIESSLESYCRELTFDLWDEDFYDTLDFSIIPESARIEVFTRIVSMDEYDEYEEVDVSDRPLSLKEAKAGLALHFGVNEDDIQITIKG